MTLQNKKNRQDTTGVQDVEVINELQKKKQKMNSWIDRLKNNQITEITKQVKHVCY